MIISGLIINYGVVLIFHSLQNSILVSSILAIIGVSCYLVVVKRTINRKIFSNDSSIKLFGIILTSGFIIGPILALPLIDWDARSIWFFHAKMIYVAGSLNQNSGWLFPSALFSHVDYPNLVPTLAAQITYLYGFWNEYLPKASLIFILLPAVILLFTFYRRSFSFLFLIILIPISFCTTLWNGYMDSYISFYFALSMLLLGRFYSTSQITDLISSIFCLILLLYIKNEGALTLIAGICAIVVAILMKNLKLSKKLVFLKNWKYFLLIILLVVPFGIWNLYKNQWGLSNDLALGTGQTFVHLFNRIEDGSYKVIFEKINIQMTNGLLLLVFLFLASIALRIRIPRLIIPIIIAGGIYYAGIFLIYMVTPMDLLWHLEFSVDRTILTVTVCVYVTCYYLISNLELLEDNKLRRKYSTPV